MNGSMKNIRKSKKGVLTMAKPAPRCIRCNQKMRNDGTETAPKWVCNNPKCVRYVPPVEPEEDEATEDEK